MPTTIDHGGGTPQTWQVVAGDNFYKESLNQLALTFGKFLL